MQTTERMFSRGTRTTPKSEPLAILAQADDINGTLNNSS